MRQLLIAILVGAAAGALAIRFATAKIPTQNVPVMIAVLGFVAFAIYWTAAATNAPAKSAESGLSRKVHEILVNAAYLFLLLPLAMPGRLSVLEYRFLPATFATAAVGLGLQAASFALAVWARRTLGQNWSGRIEIKVEHELIRSGPYRFLRHPIYTAVLGMTVGVAITIGKVHGLIAIALILLAYFRKIRLEEANLCRAFGPTYEQYRRETWGFVPGLF